MQERAFKTARALRAWLARNHARSDGMLLRIYRKDAGIASVTYAEALDEALCFGWIDGQKLPKDADSWLQKFMPRRPGSAWSKRNTEHAQRLIDAGAMTAAGLREIEAARADGRWKAAYSAFGDATAPDDFLAALARNAKAKAFFETLNRTNLYSIVYRLQTARRPETRARRMQAIIAMLARGEKFH
jgi:uncharacterized protein YdeI (YjbR/CyaY-like superfamily)